MSASTSTEQGVERRVQANPSPLARGSETIASSKRRAVKAGLENAGERDAASSEIQSVVKRVEVQAKTFKSAVRRTGEEAWELGDALRAAKEVIAHGHWEPWLQSMGLSPRLAQRCMALHRRFPDKRHMSLFRSINAAMRMLPPERALDAEFAVEEVEGPDGGSASDTPAPTNQDETPTDVTNQTSPGIIDRPNGSNGSGTRLSGIEGASNRTTVTPSRGTDLQADEDVVRDVRSPAREVDEFITLFGTVVGKDAVTATQRFGSRFGPFSQILRVLASTMANCLETAGDKETCGKQVPPDLVPTLQRLIKVVRGAGIGVQATPRTGVDSRS